MNYYLKTGKLLNQQYSTAAIQFSIQIAGSSVGYVVTDAQGRTINVLRNAKQESGIYNLDWDATRAVKGVYFISILNDGVVKQTIRVALLVFFLGATAFIVVRYKTSIKIKQLLSTY